MRFHRLLHRAAVWTAVGMLSFAAVSAETIFDTIPTPYPGSFPSLGYQATSADEAGDHIAFAGVDRDLDNVVISLTNWSCENDFILDNGVWVPDRANNEACVSTAGSGFMHPITLNIYEVDNTGADPALGPLITTKTGSYFIPFRPSWDAACTPPDMDIPFGGTWLDPVSGNCVHGYAFNIVFDFSADGIVLPDEVIYGVAYNTQSHGGAPIGAPGPYDSLNHSLNTVPPTIGTDVEDDTTWWDTSFAGFYCDLGAGGTDTFRRDAGCWNPFVYVAQFNTPDIGACCTNGAGTNSECIETTQDECELDGGLFLGAGTQCDLIDDCVPLLVEMDSMTAQKTATGIAIRWTTSFELDTVGFRVLREDGGRQKAATMIGKFVPARGMAFTSTSYEVVDPQRRAGIGSVYYIEEVDINGRTQRHGPIPVLPQFRTSPR